MTTITREFVQDIINGHGYGVAPSAVEALARIALASLTAEAVAWTEKCEITNMQATGLYLRGFPNNSQGRDIALYIAPPAPVVPDAMDYAGGVCCEVSYADGWNACRAAMLNQEKSNG